MPIAIVFGEIKATVIGQLYFEAPSMAVFVMSDSLKALKGPPDALPIESANREQSADADIHRAPVLR